MRRLIPLSLVIAIAVILPRPAEADIFSTAGAMTEIAPPASVVIGALESSTTIFVFDEGISPVPLSPALFFDHIGPGAFEGTPPPYFPMPPGALLHSYLVHFDPVGTTPTTLSGSITFDPNEIIVGIQAHTPLLYSTDPYFGLGTVTYPAGGSDLDRGFDTFVTVDDTGLVAIDLNSVSVTLKAELGVDEIRIFTVTIPEPASIAVLVIVAATCGLRHRRIG